MTRRLPALILLMLALTATGFADAAGKTLSARSFPLRHKSPEKIAAAIKPLLSADGSLSIQPGANVLVVTDAPETLKQIVSAIARLDVPAQTFKVNIKLVAAYRTSGTPPAVAPDLQVVSAKLAGVLRFNAYDKLGEIVAEGLEGDPGTVEISPGYRADFKFGEFDPMSETVRLIDFKLTKVQPPKNGQASELVPLLKTSLNLKIGQTVVMGASKLPQSNRALMLVLVAERAK